MSIYNLRPYIGNIPMIGGYNLSPYILDPLWKQFGAVAYYDWTDESRIQEGATAVDVAGWDNTANPGTFDLEQNTAAAQPEWIKGYKTTGPDLIINGDFSDGSNGWTLTNAVVTNEELVVSNGSDFLLQTGVVEVGKTYAFSFDYTETISAKLRIQTNGANDWVSPDISGTGSGTLVDTFTATGTNFALEAEAFQLTGTIDNITLFELVEDNSESHILFDGINDHLEGLPPQTGDFTYLIKMSTAITDYHILLGRNDDGDRVLFIENIGTAITLRCSSGPSSTWNILGGIDITDGVTRVIALTRSGSDFNLYIDGVAQGIMINASACDMNILGRFNAGLEFEGKMYKVPIFDRALTDSEIKDISASL